ncbi:MULTISPECIES: AfsR/SARP family transcriptional regulator [Streptomyces]|uniref:AfsR/SARP family transcriptional regulator n=1 Tax=Streptomyces TaxID=1883 RepID=UPI0004C6DFDE|nr:MULTISPECIES: AfsR/SARP family transcriptional regulator [unclassified Streptomyces]KOX44170.1 hypothetical protein ADL09_26080 [Streptomyces sp. NRRL F-7442]
MKFQMLGPIEIQTSDGRQVTPKAMKLRSLLAYLCANRDEVASSSQLIDALWSGAPPQTAPTALHVYISKLRKHLQDIGLDAMSVLATRPPGYQLNLSGVALDVNDLENLLAKARVLRESGRKEEASEVFGQAIALWRGRALEDLRDIPAFDSIGRQLDERRVLAQEQRFELELELGNHTAIIGELFPLVDNRTTSENLHGLLMIALYRSGRTAEALATYSCLRRNLVDDFGIEPTPRLQRLQYAILAHDPSLDGHGAHLLNAV